MFAADKGYVFDAEFAFHNIGVLKIAGSNHCLPMIKVFILSVAWSIPKC